jgi:predicted ATPase
MLSLPIDGRYPALDLEPQQRRQKTLEALVAQVEASSRQNPLLMIFEDAHWTDPTSLETFGRIVDRVRSRPVLLIVTFRPEFEPPWVGEPRVTTPDSASAIAVIVDNITGNKSLPANVRHDIIERTDGIPLFVEEMTKSVLEAESEQEATTDCRDCAIYDFGSPRKLARLADGAARPPRPCEGGCTGRGRHRTRVLSCTNGRSDPQGGRGTAIRP